MRDYGPYPASVTRVIDGDSVVVALDLGFSIGLVDQHVRVAHIDAPEIGTAAGKAAADYARTILMPHAAIVLVSHALDKYGRILGSISVGGTDFAEAMLAAGHATPYEGGPRPTPGVA